MKQTFAALAACALSAIAPAAHAYTAYIEPTAFIVTPESPDVTLEMAFGTSFFTPVVGMPAQGVIARRPDGSTLTFGTVSVLPQATTLVTDLRTNGTYRFSSGAQLGGVTRVILVDSDWRPVPADFVVPEGAQTRTLQTVTVAEAYVSVGYPSNEQVTASAGRLSIKPITHPNLVSVAGGLELELLFDAAPLAGMPFVLYAEGDPETKLDRTFVTDANGRAHIMVDQPGRYVALVRHRADAPAGAQAEVQSYTTSLTFEAVSVLPTAPPPPPPERRRRRRN